MDVGTTSNLIALSGVYGVLLVVNFTVDVLKRSRIILVPLGTVRVRNQLSTVVTCRSDFFSSSFTGWYVVGLGCWISATGFWATVG